MNCVSNTCCKDAPLYLSSASVSSDLKALHKYVIIIIIIVFLATQVLHKVRNHMYPIYIYKSSNIVHAVTTILINIICEEITQRKQKKINNSNNNNTKYCPLDKKATELTSRENERKRTCWQSPTWTVQSTVPNLTETLICFEALRNSGNRRIHGGHHYNTHTSMSRTRKSLWPVYSSVFGKCHKIQQHHRINRAPQSLP